MENNSVYAHSLKGQPVSMWEILWYHLDAVATTTSGFCESFGSCKFGWNAGQLHDIGKWDPSFQQYLLVSNGLYGGRYDAGPKINHSSAGAYFSEFHFSFPYGRILAYLIAGHHAGLPDYHGNKTGRASLRMRLEEGKKNGLRIMDAYEELKPKLREFNSSDIPVFLRPGVGDCSESIHVWIRMKFSSLTDADFLETERCMNIERSKLRQHYKSLDELTVLYENFMKQKTADADNSLSINTVRKFVLDACLMQGKKAESKIYTLTVPTGGGKTLASLGFAIEQAKALRKARIIYVVPHISIIEQIVDEFRQIFGYNQVVEHHSNFNIRNSIGMDAEKMDATVMDMASENWDAPIIVTTTVQFFESFFAAKPRKCRKLHNVINSVVVFDEIQMLPVEVLDPCISTLNELSKNYGVTVLLCTATQPSLTKTPFGCRSLLPTVEIIKEPGKLYKQLKRVKFHFPKDINTSETLEETALKLQQHRSVLCIVNTRGDCLKLYGLMPPGQGVFHLSGLMCGAHRTTVLKRIRQRLKKGLPTKVISTQVIEAGVDINFPVVYRALSGLDSICQAAGRCNRDGSLEHGGDTYVFISPDKTEYGDLRFREDAFRNIFNAEGHIDMDNPTIFEKYFNDLYKRSKTYGREIVDSLSINAGDFEFPFRTVAKDFHIIKDDDRVSVVVRYGGSEKLVEEAQEKGVTREILRSLQRYTVSMSGKTMEKLKDEGAVDVLDPVKAKDIILQGHLRYGHDCGLSAIA